MVDEVEPDRRRAEHGHRGAIFLAPQGDNVVAGPEAAEGVPLRRRVGILGRRTAEHRDDGRSRMREEQIRGPERGVVEVRRAQQHAVETAFRQDAPGDRRARIGAHVESTTSGIRRCVSVW